MNYYEHHIGDYDVDTAHLSWLEDMAYTRLLRLYYRKESPIPADIADACRLIRASTKEQKQAVESVLQEFFTLGVDGWHQKRCDADVGRYQKKAEHNRAVGKLGGRPKKVETQTEPTNNPMGLIREPEPNPLQTPDTIHKEIPPKPPRGSVHGFPPRFEEFWEAYPKKVGKDAAARAFAKRSVGSELLASMLEALEWQRSSTAWAKDGGQYVPNPATWLNEGRWLDAKPGCAADPELQRLFALGRR